MLVWAGGVYHSPHMVNCHFFFNLVQDTAQSQSDLIVEAVQEKSNVHQAILEMQKKFEAVRINPNLFSQLYFWLCH